MPEKNSRNPSGQPPHYEIFPPKLDSPGLVAPTDPYLKPPDYATTRKPWSNPSKTPVYGDPTAVKGPDRDPSPRDRGPNEANDFRPPVIQPGVRKRGEEWKSEDK